MAVCSLTSASLRHGLHRGFYHYIVSKIIYPPPPSRHPRRIARPQGWAMGRSSRKSDLIYRYHPICSFAKDLDYPHRIIEYFWHHERRVASVFFFLQSAISGDELERLIYENERRNKNGNIRRKRINPFKYQEQFKEKSTTKRNGVLKKRKKFCPILKPNQLTVYSDIRDETRSIEI